MAGAGDDLMSTLRGATDFLGSLVGFNWPQEKQKDSVVSAARQGAATCPIQSAWTGDTMSQAHWVRLAGLAGAMAVGIGAYGAHVLRENPDVDARRKMAFDTGNRYHLIHSAVLLATPLTRRPAITGSLLLVGMLLFSGTCYHYGLTGQDNLRRFTPFGGMMLIAAWLSMIF